MTVITIYMAMLLTDWGVAADTASASGRTRRHVMRQWDHGMTPTKVLALRRFLGRIATSAGAGRCLTIALALDLGQGDPTYAAVF